MIPYGDNIQGPQNAWGTFILIAGMSVFMAAQSLGSLSPDQMGQVFALYPDDFIRHPIKNSYRLMTATFLHFGILHLLFNMLYLYVFGKTVEKIFGTWRYFLIFPLLGVPGFLFDAILRHDSSIPIAGASGAIAALMGLYLALAPWAKIKTYFGSVVVFSNLKVLAYEVPAWTVLLYFIVLQLVSFYFDSRQHGGVAFDVHIVGFAFGWLLGESLLRLSERMQDRVEEIQTYVHIV